MLSAFSAYIKTITALTIFSAMVCIIMPDGSFRRYAELILGVMVLTVVLGPLLKILNVPESNWQWNYERIHTLPQEEDYAQIEADAFHRAYTQVLKEKIQADIDLGFTNVFCNRIVIYEEENDANYGGIEKIWISCEEKDKTDLVSYLARQYGVEENKIIIGDVTKER